jgi:hypothetical protein
MERYGHSRTGLATLIRSVAEVVPDDLRAAEALVVGCWTRVNTPFGGEPARHMVEWIEGLPNLDGKPVGVFCTFAFFPHTFADTTARVSEVLAALTRAFELRGGKVVSSYSLHLGEFEGNASALVSEVADHMAA